MGQQCFADYWYTLCMYVQDLATGVSCGPKVHGNLLKTARALPIITTLQTNRAPAVSAPVSKRRTQMTNTAYFRL